jgi:carboxypeptidase C (cathepsin A)
MRKRPAMAMVLTMAIVATQAVIAQPLPTPPPDTSVITRPDKSVTKHSIKIDGKIVNYTAVAGTLLLKNDKDESIALFGYTAYIKDGEADVSHRPLTFAYNGGPGSSSMWLHLGALGPRRVALNDPTYNPPPPYKLEDNEHSIIDVTDLVMVDPIGTGLSHPIGKATNKDFWGVDQDIKSISQFVTQYIKENDRWNSPKFLLGESYGTTRSAGIANYLQDNMGVQLNGVVLVSAVLDIHTLTFADDISHVLYIPTYAAVAWYHNKLSNKPADLEAFLKEVRTFSQGEYAVALQKGDLLSDVEKGQIAAKLSGYTGLSREYWIKANLRVPQQAFSQELLRDDHQTVGRLDARYKGINQDLLSEFAFEDPQSTQISPPYIASFMNYYYSELKVNKNYNYHVSVYSAEGFKWDWHHAPNGGEGFPVTPNTSVDMAGVMSKNPNLKILVLNGYFDLATPFFGTEYTFDHMGLERKVRNNVTMKYYPAGHMMYIHTPSLVAFKKDVAAFIQEVSR